MKFIHTFWSKPFIENKFEEKKKSIVYTLTDYACSVAGILNSGYEIDLYTDEFGSQLLGWLPYSNIIVLPDDDSSIHFAAQFKFKAMERINLGDVLIDGDLIIRSKDTCRLIEENDCDVLYSFVEPIEYILKSEDSIKYYVRLFKNLDNFDFKEPYKLPKYYEISWPNTSMLKITNEELKNEYISQYNYHRELISSSNICFGKDWPDIIIEQFFLKRLMDSMNVKHMPFIDNFPTKEGNDKALELKFTHIGACKISHNYIIDDWLKEANLDLYNLTHEKITEQLKNQ